MGGVRTVDPRRESGKHLRNPLCRGNQAIIGLLLDRGASFDNFPQEALCTMVFAVPYFDDDLEDRICGRAEEPSEPLADVTWVSETPLHRASYEGSLSDVRQLLDQGANVNATATVRPERNELTPPQSEGVSPLHSNTQSGCIDSWLVPQPGRKHRGHKHCRVDASPLGSNQRGRGSGAATAGR